MPEQTLTSLERRNLAWLEGKRIDHPHELKTKHLDYRPDDARYKDIMFCCAPFPSTGEAVWLFKTVEDLATFKTINGIKP